MSKWSAKERKTEQLLAKIEEGLAGYVIHPFPINQEGKREFENSPAGIQKSCLVSFL